MRLREYRVRGKHTLCPAQVALAEARSARRHYETIINWP
jgi:hypothetical protein